VKKKTNTGGLSFYLDQAGSGIPFYEILRKLMDGSYSTLTGHPDAHDSIERFVKDVTSRIPELRGKDEWEIEEAVQEAVEWAIKSICKPVKAAEVNPATPDYYEFVGVYSCVHPGTGQFYIAVNEEEDAASGYGYWGVTITRDREEAMERYRAVVEDWKERGAEYEEW